MVRSSYWHLIYTKPRQELEAQQQLERQGYKTYLPILSINHGKSSNLQNRTAPLFPRYLFISLTEGVDDWSPIRSTYGVSKLVRFGIETARIPDSLVTAIQSRERDDGLHHEEKTEFRQGDKISIIDGPLSGYDAIFQTHCGEERVLILLDLIGKQSKTAISMQSIAKDT